MGLKTIERYRVIRLGALNAYESCDDVIICFASVCCHHQCPNHARS